MLFERFIARRFMPRRGGGFSGPLSTIAVVGIALGVIVMVMAVSILRGFQADISGKVVGFGSHITLSLFSGQLAYADAAVAMDGVLIDSLRATTGVKHVQCYANKGGMVKTTDQIYGIMFRGLSADYDTTFFASCLVEGHLPIFTQPQTCNEVLVSTTIANKLDLKVGDKMRTYFWQGGTAGSNAVADGAYRSRAFTVCGLYNTDLTEMDELYVIGDLRQVQKLNGWGDSLVGGYEILVDNFDRLDETCTNILNARRTVGENTMPLLPYDMQMVTVRQANPALFSWLDLLEANITLILAIMCLVSAVAIVSALLIMIFEKSSTIGLLKALGACNRSVRRIFLMKASQLIVLGVVIGDAIALALSYVQYRWHPITLDPESYSMAHVPVEISAWTYIAISLGTVAVCLVALLLPARYISGISPARTMRVER